jgi:pyrroloquinoline quinone biosynthesis protein B
MRVRLLGTAAGGGFPQWNCGCANCRGVRAGTLRATPRTQSCVAVSADGVRWFLVNASPDVARQLESFPPLLPPAGCARGSGVAGVLLTGADLDHTLGLLILREGRRLAVHAMAAVREALSRDFNVDAVLSRYCGIEWREPPTAEGLTDLRDAAGRPSGLRYAAFPLAGKPPRYSSRPTPGPGDAVGYRFVDAATGGRLVCVPGLAALDDVILRQLADCDLLLLDGTFWSNDEMSRAGVGAATAGEMGHLPVGGPGGSLAHIAPLPVRHMVYVHINNTNPMLVDDSPERRAVESAGVTVGSDGMEFTL